MEGRETYREPRREEGTKESGGGGRRGLGARESDVAVGTVTCPVSLRPARWATIACGKSPIRRPYCTLRP